MRRMNCMELVDKYGLVIMVISKKANSKMVSLMVLEDKSLVKVTMLVMRSDGGKMELSMGTLRELQIELVTKDYLKMMY